MGSPLGPLLADIFMSKLENTHLKKIIDNFGFYKRYVDDTFIIANNEENLENILDFFNSCHPAIQFTLEKESNATISFLDVQLARREQDGTLKRSIHRKPTWNGQLISFHSWVPIYTKRNLIRSLTHRIHNICSPETIEEELKTLKRILLENGYPERFITKAMKPKTQKPSMLTAPKKLLYLNLQFNGDSSAEILRNRLCRSLKKTFFAAELRLTFSTKPMIRTNVKDKLPLGASSMCIYQFTCSCGARYVGRTQRLLSKRISEHLPSWFYKGERRSPRHSSILEHLIESGHQANPQNNFSVIYTIRGNLAKRVRIKLLQTAEAMAIHILNPELCIQKKFVQSLNLQWS
uniref:Reverse transcriptase domain-containing protein n=1 Tax=Trichobilharzia regenti TaxID=157069 RepID=A0AA85JLA3_TRIRE|nr:unnamed protein product [Trichobilharzia regenti]CAH8845810.1 unnamed protein product [Trichobilharzia regenti]